MFFLRPKLLELFTCLVFNPDKRLILDEDFFKTDYYGRCNNNIPEHKFWDNLKGHFLLSPRGNQISVELRNRESTIKFLKEYLLKYKKRELEIPRLDSTGDYYSYVQNLYNMDNVLNHFSQGIEPCIFSTNSVKVCMEGKFPTADSKIRFAEFLLDLYFEYRESFTIRKCEITKIRLGFDYLYCLHVELVLNEHPSKLPAHLHKKLDNVEFWELKSTRIGSLLGDTELKIVKLASKDYSNSEIATELKFEVSTVKNKLQNIYRKLEEYYPQFQGGTKGKNKLLKELYESSLNSY